MSRGLSAPQVTAASSASRGAVQLVQMDFLSGTLRLANCQWNIVHAGDTYTAAAFNVKQLRESSNSIEGAEFSMSGIDAAVMAIADQENYVGRIATLMKAYIDPDTNLVIGAPVIVFIGRMKSMPAQETNSACDISVIAEHYDADLGRPAPTRLNDSDQQRNYPGDLGCQHAEETVEQILVWPAREALQR